MTDDYAHVSQQTERMLWLSERSERLRARRDKRRYDAILLLACGVINAGFLAWDVVRGAPVGADAVEGLLMLACLGFGVRVWREWRILRGEYEIAHASYMTALRGE